MEIPKGYIKCIRFDVRTKEHSNIYMYQLTYLLKEYTAPNISDGNYTIGFTLIKPLNIHILKLLLDFDGIEYFEDVEYVPYNRDKSIDYLIEDEFNGKYHDIDYLIYLLKFMPKRPIIEKLSSVKFTVNIPNEIIKLDKLLQYSNIENYFNDIPNNYFTNKFLEKIVRDYDLDYMYETKINENTITIYLIQLIYRSLDKIQTGKVKNNSSKYIQDIEINNKDTK